MNCAIYARVSTRDKGQDFTNQLFSKSFPNATIHSYTNSAEWGKYEGMGTPTAPLGGK